MIGKADWRGGITQRVRVSEGEQAILDRLNGFKVRNGYLEPEGTSLDVTSGSALSGTTPEQSPFAFNVDGDLTIVARDSAEKMRKHISGSWGTAGAVADILSESVPIRLREQIAFGAGGPQPMIMAYEPDAPAAASPLLGTNLRPLSLKSPVDYNTSVKPVVTPSAFAGLQLFDNNGTANSQTNWVKGAGYTAGGSPDTPDTEVIVTNSADTTTVVMTSLVDAGTIVAKKDLGTVGVLLTGKPFIVLDMSLSDDEQLYDEAGLFGNNGDLFPSGYIVHLWSAQNCTGEIASFRIPKLSIQGKVHRVVINIGTLTATAKSVSIETDSFWTPPITGKTYTLTLYSEAFTDSWNHKGNFLMPAVKYQKGDWADVLTSMLNSPTGKVFLEPTGNLIVNGDFEDGGASTGWTVSGGGVLKNTLAHSGSWAVELDRSPRAITSQDYTSISAGSDYTLSYYFLSYKASAWQTRITWYDSGNNPTNIDFACTSDISIEWRFKDHQFTLPATAVKFNVIFTATATQSDFRIDDVVCFRTNQAQSGSATVLQTFNADGEQRTHETPVMRYVACFAGKDRLSLGTHYKLLGPSNPSMPSNPDVVSDPWRTYSVAFTVPSGPIATAVKNGAGTGYTVGDVLTIADGTNGKVRVATITGGGATGPVGTVTLLDAGYGYSTATAATTTGGTGTGATVNTTAATAITEYGDYLTHVVFYRSIYSDLGDDTQDGIWSDFEYFAKGAIAATVTVTDSATAELNTVDGKEIPFLLESDNDFASSARHLAYNDRTVFAGCCDLDPETGNWLRPSTIQCSNYDETWKFPTTLEIAEYQVTGSVIRGLMGKRDSLFAWLDNERFEIRFAGTSDVRAVRIDSIGLESSRTLAECGEMFIWKYGNDFFASSGGNPAQRIGRGLIDASLIDLTAPHNAVYYDDYYLLFCEYDGVNAILSYDLKDGGWRVRYSYSSDLNLVGICTDGIDVYGLTTDGNVKNLFTGTGATYRDVRTQYLRVGPPGRDWNVSEAIFEIVTDQEAGVDVVLTFDIQGKKADIAEVGPITQTVLPGCTRYNFPLNCLCDAIRWRLEYTGSTCPDVHFMGVEPDAGVAARQ